MANLETDAIDMDDSEELKRESLIYGSSIDKKVKKSLNEEDLAYLNKRKKIKPAQFSLNSNELHISASLPL